MARHESISYALVQTVDQLKMIFTCMSDIDKVFVHTLYDVDEHKDPLSLYLSHICWPKCCKEWSAAILDQDRAYIMSLCGD